MTVVTVNPYGYKLAVVDFVFQRAEVFAAGDSDCFIFFLPHIFGNFFGTVIGREGRAASKPGDCGWFYRCAFYYQSGCRN